MTSNVTPMATRNMAEGAISILPAIIDAVASPVHVPDKFRSVHFIAMPRDEAPAGFVARLKELLSAKVTP